MLQSNARGDRRNPAQREKYEQLHGDDQIVVDPTETPHEEVQRMLDELDDEELEELNDYTLEILGCADPINPHEDIYEQPLRELSEELDMIRVDVDLDELAV